MSNQRCVLQAIVTRYLGHTNVRGARTKATCAGGSVTLYYDHRLNQNENHRRAADAMMKKMEWDVLGWELVAGTLPNGDQVFVQKEPVK